MGVMQRCAHCGGCGLHDDDGRYLCMLCSRIVTDPAPTMTEQILSNVTPEAKPDGDWDVWGPRQRQDIDAMRDRVLDSIRASGGRP